MDQKILVELNNIKFFLEIMHRENFVINPSEEAENKSHVKAHHKSYKREPIERNREHIMPNVGLRNIGQPIASIQTRINKQCFNRVKFILTKQLRSVRIRMSGHLNLTLAIKLFSFIERVKFAQIQEM